MNRFVKSHGLGNEYIVLEGDLLSFALTKKNIQQICNVHYGIGSDGILLKIGSDSADFGLRIFNPDGSEAEKSGNGLRIFCKYLFDYEFAKAQTFSVETKGGIVHAEIKELNNSSKASIIKIDMGKANFQSKEIPVRINQPECLQQALKVKEKTYTINCVSVGNPHCVILKETLDESEIREYGSLIEHHPQFPNRINVQFVKVLNRKEAQILIWERGAGFTNASGSSSSAVASVLKKLGLADGAISIKMPGGELQIEIDDDWQIRMTGEVKQVAEGKFSKEFIEDMKSND